MIQAVSTSSVRPPKFMHPRQRGLTLTPVRPKLRYSMDAPPLS